MICTFFGHRECYGLEEQTLQHAIEEEILQGADRFYVGHQGEFDSMVLNVLLKLKNRYPHVSFAVVLAYLPREKTRFSFYKDHSIYPTGLEHVPPKFAIEKRNKWMIEQSHRCLCYVNYSFGGAFRFARLAKQKGLAVTNLGSLDL